MVLNLNEEVLDILASNEYVAFVGSEEGGPDIYLMNLENSQVERITFIESRISLIKFEGNDLYFLSNHQSETASAEYLFKINLKTLIYENLKTGPISWVDFQKKDLIVQKNGYGYVNWKRYKGGARGKIFLNDKELVEKKHNLFRPFFHEDRIYFQTDDNGCGNIASCKKDGSDYQTNTNLENYYVRDLRKHKDTFTYSCGGDLGVYDAKLKQNKVIKIEGKLPHPDGIPFIPNPAKYLTNFDVNKSELAFSIRGSVYACKKLAGGFIKLSDDLRYRATGFLSSGKIFAFKDPPKSKLVIFEKESYKKEKEFELETGKIVSWVQSSKEDILFFTNHKNELIKLNIDTQETKLIDKAFHSFKGMDISQDGNWLVYSKALSSHVNQICLYDIKNETKTEITSGRYNDYMPNFDPQGNFIYFISNRNLSCEYDDLKFDISFQENPKLFLITLNENYIPLRPWEKCEDEEEDIEIDEEDSKKDKDSKKTEKEDLKIDLENIQERIVELSAEEKNYMGIMGINNDKVMLLHHEDEDGICADVLCLKTFLQETVYKKIINLSLSNNKEDIVIFDGKKVKCLKTGEKGDDSNKFKSGAFDWNRFSGKVNPKKEWQQMFEEVLYFMKEFFWSEKLAGIDIKEVLKKYEPHAQNIRSRQELNDIFNEMQGELGASHAFVLNDGKKCKKLPKIGKLGAVFKWNKEENAFQIDKILDSDHENGIQNPIKFPGINAKVGEFIFSIDNQELNEEYPLEKALFGKADTWITLEIGKTKETARKVDIKTIKSETELYYRTWVNENRNFVEKVSNDKVGYIHIPDMQIKGFKEFFQNYMFQYKKPGLVLDLRNNRGGHVSPLIIEQIRRKTLGIDFSRWNGLLEIPNESNLSTIVLLINEFTASDGEMFAKQFQDLGLGIIIGKQTWGGVIGILPRYELIDGGLTSQPEFASWFKNIGFKLENQGVKPDIEIENSYKDKENRENDLQLKRGILEALKENKDYNLFEEVKKEKHPEKS